MCGNPFFTKDRPGKDEKIFKPMHRMHECIGRDGSIGCLTNAYIEGTVVVVGADIFPRGVCLPSDNKMTEAEQE